MKKNYYELQADICKALSHPVRIQIIELLSKGEMGFSELAEQTNLLKSNLSQQLSILLQLNLISFQKNGQSKIFRLSYTGIKDVVALINTVLQQISEDKINALNSGKDVESANVVVESRL